MATELIFRLVMVILALLGLCCSLAVILDVLNQKVDKLEIEENRKTREGKND